MATILFQLKYVGKKFGLIPTPHTQNLYEMMLSTPLPTKFSSEMETIEIFFMCLIDNLGGVCVCVC